MAPPTYVVRRKRSEIPLWREARLRLEQLDIELTERCNNNCIHCCINRPPDDTSALAREMKTDQVKNILRQAADLGCLQVRFTGGEPLLRTDFEDLYEYGRRLGMKVLLFTNGRLITRPLADLFSRMPPLLPIEITVYGMHRESYEGVTRSRGSFEQFGRGVDLLLERDVPFVVKSAILPQNKHEMEEFEAWAGSIPWMTMPPSYVMFLDLRNRRDDAGKNATIRSLRLLPQEVVEVLTRDPGKYRRDMAAFASMFMGRPDNRLFTCGGGQGICVDAYGYVQPCMSLRAPELTVKITAGLGPTGQEKAASAASASKKEAGMGTVADALDHFRQFRDLRANNPEYLRRCGRCFLKGLCEQCPAKSWMEHGNLDTPVDYLCEAAHAQARYLGWLEDDEHGWEVTDWRKRMNTNRSWDTGDGSPVSGGNPSGLAPRDCHQQPYQT